MSQRPFLFAGGPGLLGNVVFRKFLESHTEIALGPEINLLHHITSTYENVIKAEVYLKEFLLAPQNFEEAFTQMIRMVLDETPGASKCRWIAEISVLNSICFEALHSLFPESMMIMVVQDARSMISAKLEKEELGQEDRKVRLYELANEWVKAAEPGLKSMNSGSVASRAGLLRLEYLIENPSQTSQTLTQPLGLSPESFNHSEFEEFLKVHGIREGLQDWRQKLNVDDLKILNHVCGSLLQELNYFGL